MSASGPSGPLVFNNTYSSRKAFSKILLPFRNIKKSSLDRVATVREKVLENEKISRSGKSQGITFSVMEIKKK